MTMKFLPRLIALALLFPAAGGAQEVETPPPGAAPAQRARLLEFAGALANDGFRLRDSFWSGRLESGRPRRLAVNLFAGNHYWFCAAADSPEGAPVLAVYDPRGEPLEVLAHREAGVSAAGVTAGATGRYIVEVKSSRGPAADFCLVYLFK